jgi:hypothetical protein
MTGAVKEFEQKHDAIVTLLGGTSLVKNYTSLVSSEELHLTRFE